MQSRDTAKSCLGLLLGQLDTAQYNTAQDTTEQGWRVHPGNQRISRVIKVQETSQPNQKLFPQI